jgi:hypothetical protein
MPAPCPAPKILRRRIQRNRTNRYASITQHPTHPTTTPPWKALAGVANAGMCQGSLADWHGHPSPPAHTGLRVRACAVEPRVQEAGALARPESVMGLSKTGKREGKIQNRWQKEKRGGKEEQWWGYAEVGIRSAGGVWEGHVVQKRKKEVGNERGDGKMGRNK